MTALEKRIERRNAMRTAILTALERAHKYNHGDVDTAVCIEVELEKLFRFSLIKK